MRNRHLLWVVVLAFVSSGFRLGDPVEVQNLINARKDSDVRVSTKNILFALSPKTRGTIRSLKRLRNGNFALELELTNGSYSGKKVWVFYDKNRPSLKLFSNPNGDKQSRTSNIDQARSAVTTRRIPAAEVQAEEASRKIEGNLARIESHVISQPLTGTSAEGDCWENIRHETQLLSTATEETESAMPLDGAGPYAESRSTPYSSDFYSGGLPMPRCVSRDENYSVCEENGEVTSFSLRNSGPNSVVDNANHPEKDHRFREFEFYFPGGARQEVEVRIADSMSGRLSKVQESYIKLFPRKVKPSIRVEGAQTQVTLPTGEQVLFRSDTHEILSGVFSERSLKDGAPAAVQYSGVGVMVRADKRGADPRISGNTATITKPQCKPSERCEPCRVPVTDLWTNEPDQPRFRFPADPEFDSYLRNRCGFGI